MEQESCIKRAAACSKELPHNARSREKGLSLNRFFCYYICQLNFYFFKLAWCIMQNKMGTIFWNSWDSAKDTSLLAILWNSNSSSDSKPFICCAHGLCTTVSLFLFLIFGLETSFRNCLFYTLLCILGMNFPVPLLLFIHTSV